jgi:phage gp36-like protein
VSYVDQGDLEKVARGNVVRVFDEDGDGIADPHLVAEACEAASGHLDSFLLEGFGPEGVRKLLNDDPILVRHVAWVAMHFGAQGKAEWRDGNGNAMFRAEFVDATKHFDALAKGKARSKGEARAGENVMTRGRVNRGCPNFVFASSRNDPKGPGGF